MKRIITFIIILSAISISTGSVFGDDCSNSCSIKDAPAPVLQEYIDNNRKIISNIANQLTPDSDNSIAGVVSREYIKIYNSITNWNTFSSWVNFISFLFFERNQVLGEIWALSILILNQNCKTIIIRTP